MTAQPKAVPPIPEGTSTVMPWIISHNTVVAQISRIWETLKANPFSKRGVFHGPKNPSLSSLSE